MDPPLQYFEIRLAATQKIVAGKPILEVAVRQDEDTLNQLGAIINLPAQDNFTALFSEAIPDDDFTTSATLWRIDSQGAWIALILEPYPGNAD